MLRLAELNLIDAEHWQDLISGEVYSDRAQQFELKPYQTVWISNMASHTGVPQQ